MVRAWKKHCEKLLAQERRRLERQRFLSQFWIWQPYSVYSLPDHELVSRGFKNLGNNNQDDKGKMNEQ